MTPTTSTVQAARARAAARTIPEPLLERLGDLHVLVNAEIIAAAQDNDGHALQALAGIRDGLAELTVAIGAAFGA